MGKKKDKKHSAVGLDLAAEVKRLRKENEHLRKRLRKIADLAEQDAQGPETDSVDEEIDDVSAAEEASPVPAG